MIFSNDRRTNNTTRMLNYGMSKYGTRKITLFSFFSIFDASKFWLKNYKHLKIEWNGGKKLATEQGWKWRRWKKKLIIKFDNEVYIPICIAVPKLRGSFWWWFIISLRFRGRPFCAVPFVPVKNGGDSEFDSLCTQKKDKKLVDTLKKTNAKNNKIDSVNEQINGEKKLTRQWQRQSLKLMRYRYELIS